MRVLLVDDSLTMRRIIKNLLTKYGVSDVVEAASGLEAVNKLKSYMPVDLIFMDWNMPEMDGLTAVRQIRTNFEFKDVKIIMCTSESERERVIEALQAGAQDYIVKPITPETLKQKLAAFTNTSPDPVV
jgi:two-component system, chemotaxis family, chemotaxis protein CheY